MVAIANKYVFMSVLPRPIRVGGPDQVEVVDGVLRLWFTLAQSRGRRIAFKLISD